MGLLAVSLSPELGQEELLEQSQHSAKARTATSVQSVPSGAAATSPVPIMIFLLCPGHFFTQGFTHACPTTPRN